MVKYLFKRLLQGLVSVVIVVACVMVMIYSLMDRTLIFAKDTNYSHQSNNQKVAYRYEKWETYGYLDYVTYADYLNDLATKGEIDEETRSSAVSIGRKAKKDSDLVKEYDCPICFGFPVGHVTMNVPMINGAQVTLEVGKKEVKLSFNTHKE